MSNDLLHRLHGPLPALPRVLDRAVERWWRWPPRLRLALIAALVALALGAAGRGATRSPWGPPVEVLVAARDLATGQSLTPAGLTSARWPRDLVPPDALDGLADGLTLAGPVPAGAVVTDRHLVDGGVAATVGPDRGALPLARDLLPPLEPGQTVDLVAATADGSGQRLAGAARVLAVRTDHVWVDVAREEAPSVAAAAGLGGVTVVVLPPPAAGSMGQPSPPAR